MGIRVFSNENYCWSFLFFFFQEQPNLFSQKKLLSKSIPTTNLVHFFFMSVKNYYHNHQIQFTNNTALSFIRCNHSFQNNLALLLTRYLCPVVAFLYLCHIIRCFLEFSCCWVNLTFMTLLRQKPLYYTSE